MENTQPVPAAEPPKRVLIVDDDAGVRTMLGRVLAGEGYAVRSEDDGEEALAAARAEPFDLVLLDLALPPTNGWDIFSRLRTMNPLLPVVIITARFGEAATAAMAGAEALLEKPLDYPTLLRTLAAILAEPAPSSRAPNPFHAKRDQS